VPDWSANPINPQVEVYSQQFVAQAPDIDELYADPVTVTSTQTYEVTVPNDLLELTA
jgi:hypothetical protein